MSTNIEIQIEQPQYIVEVKNGIDGLPGYTNAGDSQLLTSLANLSSNGIVTKTGTTSTTTRTITGTSNEISITNGDGVSGNPAISLPSSITLTGKTVTGGTYNNAVLSTSSKLDANADENFTFHSMSRQSIINGNFDVWQRGTTLTNPTSGSFICDRWKIFNDANGGTLPTRVHSRQSFTTGALANSFYFYRINVNGAGTSLGNSSFDFLTQNIEFGTRFLAGASRKVTVSFWARSSISNKKLGISLRQNYGTGGSPSSEETINGTNWTLTSTLTKYTYTFTTNTLTGKTFGSNNDDFLSIRFWNMWGSSLQSEIGASGAETYVGSGNIEIAQVQLCAGDVALPFQAKSFEQELVACQRYYQKSYNYLDVAGTVVNNGSIFINVGTATTANLSYTAEFKVPMRATPTNITFYDLNGATNLVFRGANGKTATIAWSSEKNFLLNCTDATSSSQLGFHYTADAEL